MAAAVVVVMVVVTEQVHSSALGTAVHIGV